MASPQWRPGKRAAVVGGGPGAISTALALLKDGYDVRVFERQRRCTAAGSNVLLCVPVLGILRSYGMSLDGFGAPAVLYFKNSKGLERVKLPHNPVVNERMGIEGWHYGVQRSSAFDRMLKLVPGGVIYPSHEFVQYTENDDSINLEFSNGATVTADILVGADGIRSSVSRQAFGDPHLSHTGTRVWLAWCYSIPDIPSNAGVVFHDWQYQASYFPMLHDGKPGFQWWVVERSWEGKPMPENPKEHFTNLLKDWADPMPRFPKATNFDEQVYLWEIYNRPSMKKWSKGRVVCVGDAVHPVSPYAAYGMGMAIEDGYFLARSLQGIDLRDLRNVSAGFEVYEQHRVEYVNHNMEFARFLGKMFHSLPHPLAWIRDTIFDYTPFLQKFLSDGYLREAEKETMELKELHITK